MTGEARHRVSVVLPLHNAGGYLARTLEQLQALDRSACDYQFVIVDDHSTDDTGMIIRSWAQELQGTVTVLEAEGNGVASARNQALAHCTGTFVWFVDADDTWSPSIVSEMVAVAVTEDADLVACNALRRTPSGRDRGVIEDAPTSEVISGPDAFVYVLSRRMQGHLWNKLFRRAALPLPLFPATRAYSDLGGMLRLTPQLSRVAYLPRSLYTYFLNPGSILNRRDYRYEDLSDCLAIARTTMTTHEISAPRALRHFTYRNVVIPLASEAVRRTHGEPWSATRDALAHARRIITPRELIPLAASGDIAIAATTALIRFTPRAYAILARARAATMGATAIGDTSSRTAVAN